MAGLQVLAAQLGKLGSVLIAIERAEGLLVEFLQTLPKVTVYCVSPKISARARERSRLSASKSDSFDAFVLADTLQGHPPVTARSTHPAHRWIRAYVQQSEVSDEKEVRCNSGDKFRAASRCESGPRRRQSPR